MMFSFDRVILGKTSKNANNDIRIVADTKEQAIEIAKAKRIYTKEEKGKNVYMLRSVDMVIIDEIYVIEE